MLIEIHLMPDCGLLPIIKRMAEIDPDTARWFIPKIQECQGKGPIELDIDEVFGILDSFNKTGPLKFEIR